MSRILAVGYPSGKGVDVVVMRDGVIRVCRGTVQTEEYASDLERPGWYMAPSSAEELGVSVDSRDVCSTMPDDLTLGAWLGQKTLFWFVDYRLLDEGADASYILFSKDPRYALKEGPSGKKRWMLTTKSGLLIPQEGAYAPSALLDQGSGPLDLVDKIASIRTFRGEAGHSRLFIVEADDGKQYTLKWNDAVTADSESTEWLRDFFGAHSVVDLLPEYEKLYLMTGTPHMPQWRSGSLDELKGKYDGIYKAMIENYDDSAEKALEAGELAKHLVSSPYIEDPRFDWRYFGEDEEEAARNFAFLQGKIDAMRALVGPPDRNNPGNYLVYALVDPEGNPLDGRKVGGRTLLKVDIDYDWYPFNLSDDIGMYSGTGGHIIDRDDIEWDDAMHVASRSIQEAMDACGVCDIEDHKEQLLHEGQTNPDAEGFFDVMSHIRDFRLVPKGHAPSMVADAYDELYLADDEIQGAVEAWEEVREDRLKGSG